MSHVPQLEHLVLFMSKHADGILKDHVGKLQNKLIEFRSLLFACACASLMVCPNTIVYDDLSHPPATYLGAKYSHRTPDGSYNNISCPMMGKANEPYARSVQQKDHLPLNMLPDAGLVFDTFLKREKVRGPGHLSFVDHS
jgi:hypothetical protein